MGLELLNMLIAAGYDSKMSMIMNVQPHPNVQATIRKYLTNKVREKFPEDYHLIESMMEQLVSRYSLKELYMVCAVEINRLKNNQRPEGRQTSD